MGHNNYGFSRAAAAEKIIIYRLDDQRIFVALLFASFVFPFNIFVKRKFVELTTGKINN